MTIDDLFPGRYVEVSYPPPGVIGKHWVLALVREATKHGVAIMLVGHPLWRKHYIGVTVNKRDLAFGLVRECTMNRCRGCGFPVPRNECDADGVCAACLHNSKPAVQR